MVFGGSGRSPGVCDREYLTYRGGECEWEDGLSPTGAAGHAQMAVGHSQCPFLMKPQPLS